MPTTLLYYPTINIPTSGAWIRQALLYWDNIASIVPDSYDGGLQTDHFSPEIQCLHEEGVFRPISPAKLFESNRGVRFSDEIEKIVRSRSFIRSISTEKKVWVNIPIYKDKVAASLFSSLSERGLASGHTQIPGGDMFYFFDRRVFGLYMALMAEYLAELDGPLTFPGTDIPSFLSGTLHTDPTQIRTLSTSAYFQRLLPTPRSDSSIRAILSFRTKHSAELASFRIELDTVRTELGNASSARELKSKGQKLLLRVERESKRLERALNKAKIETFLGSMQAFFISSVPAVFGAGGAAALGVPLSPESILGVAGIFGSLQVATHLTRRSGERDALLQGNPFAYLVLANRRFGLPHSRAGGSIDVRQ